MDANVTMAEHTEIEFAITFGKGMVFVPNSSL